MLLKLDGPPPPPCEWIVDGIIPAFGITALASQPGAGKTTLAANIAVAVASGGSVLGRQAQQAGVLFVTAESTVATHRRLRALGGADLPVAIAHGSINLLDDNASDALAQAIIDAGAMLGQKVRLVVLDALGSATRGMDENSAKDASRAMGALIAASEAAGVAVLLLAHTVKSGPSGRVRGHSSIEADLEASLAIEVQDGNRSLIAVKNRHIAEFEPITFRLQGTGEAVRVVECEAASVALGIEDRRKRAVLEIVSTSGGNATRGEIAAQLRGAGLLPNGKSGDERLREAIVGLVAEGLVTRSHDGRSVHLPPPN